MARKKTAKKRSAKSSKPAQPGKPTRVSTGGGATPEDVGKRLVADFNKGRYEINTKLWSPKLVCIEAGGMAWRGFKNVQAKNKSWNAANTILGAAAEGPYVGSTGFAVKFRIDTQDNTTGHRMLMEEIGVYTVRGGKIVQEEFMYGSMTPVETGAQALAKF